MFDLTYLQQNYALLASAFAQNPLVFAVAFFGVYVLVTAASLPFATLLTLLAGALFGFWHGVLVVSFASSLGATLAMLMARYALSGMVLRKFGSRMDAINQGIAKDGAFYLFALRLTPVVPFFMVNALMGLTTISAWTFYWTSQLGMLALTAVYVNAGTQLASLHSLAGIASPALLGSLALAGLAPLLLKKLMQANIYQPWRAVRPQTFDRNLVVIGAGAGGLVTAYIAAAVKAKVTLIEAHKMGGDCLNYGCVPSKALIKSAKVAHQMKHAAQYGLQGTDAVPSFKAVMARVRALIADIEPHDSAERYTQLGVEVLQGHAKIVNPWTVEIALNDGGKQVLTTRAIVIAAGASPIVPPVAGIEHSGYLTSDTLWDAFAKLDDIPKRITILGGGAIGCELAQALQRLGAEVTVIEAAPRLLMREDDEVSAYARAALEADGVRVRTSHIAVRVELVEAAGVLTTKAGDVELAIPYDALVVAVGRAARLEGYGLEALGILTDKASNKTPNHTLATNDYLQTIYPNIYAAGDVAGPFQLTHAAAHQAWYAAVNALFGDFKRFKVDYRVIPAATFIDPEVARMGLNEREAVAQGVAYEVTTYGIDDLDRAIVDSAAKGFVKVLTVPGQDKILGVTIVGSHAAELIAEYILAMKHGLGLSKILGTIHIYPTFSEANKYAAGAWKRAHQPERLLAWVRRFHDWRRG
jgi:pyruvate/2-oxoglutarate dehydrogenase complex dihydrolipoamide dehydrogenase (E3) component/uncharacterized membrane protein YdjX (TVP38/TMEM64 family)